MQLSKNKTSEMKAEKYGQRVKPYEFKSVFSNKSNPAKLSYNYSRTKLDGSVEWEAEPTREMIIADPSSYQGQLRRRNQWLNTKKVWIVNGVINKLDANFKENFNFAELPGTRLLIGSQPNEECEIQKLKNAGVTTILNLKS